MRDAPAGASSADRYRRALWSEQKVEKGLEEGEGEWGEGGEEEEEEVVVVEEGGARSSLLKLQNDMPGLRVVTLWQGLVERGAEHHL